MLCFQLEQPDIALEGGWRDINKANLCPSALYRGANVAFIKTGDMFQNICYYDVIMKPVNSVVQVSNNDRVLATRWAEITSEANNTSKQLPDFDLKWHVHLPLFKRSEVKYFLSLGLNQVKESGPSAVHQQDANWLNLLTGAAQVRLGQIILWAAGKDKKQQNLYEVLNEYKWSLERLLNAS